MLTASLALHLGATLRADERPLGANPLSRSAPSGATTLTSGQVFVSGTVLLAGGGLPPAPATVEFACGERVRLQGLTDADGRFKLRVSLQNPMASPMDASISGGGRMATSMSPANMRLVGCEAQAHLPGFLSSRVPVRRQSAFDSPDIGILVLRPRGDMEGESTTVSFTTLKAPKRARRAYRDAKEELGRKEPQLSKAVVKLAKAVKIYPDYAAAWYLLGELRFAQNMLPAARHAFEAALEADRKFIKPYLRLAHMDLDEGRAASAAKLTGQVLAMNPYLLSAHFYHALAQYELGDLDLAEKSVRAILEDEAGRHFPRAHAISGEILAARGDFRSAEKEYRFYLTLESDAPMSALIRQRLADLEAHGLIETYDDRPQEAALEPTLPPLSPTSEGPSLQSLTQ